jgi:sortase A
MSRAHRIVRRAAIVLLSAGLLALAYVAFVVIDANAYQTSQRRRFEQGGPAASVAPAVGEGAAIGEIQIPRLGLAAVIVQGDAADILQRAVGHLADSALPGESGNVVLAGHRDTFFRPLKRIRVGDAVTLRTVKGDFEYVVVSTAVVSLDAIEVLQPTGGRTLTLITCFPFGFVGAAPNRFIVHARDIEPDRP